MKSSAEKNAGIALLLFTILMLFTMVLHPAGGGFEHLLRITNMIIITHAIAILSLPFAAVGFWGLTKKLGTDNFFSITAYAMILFGLVATMMAATTNGLILPVFIQKYRDASPAVIESLKPILRYNFSVNGAFDYIYTVAFCLAMTCWSIAILYTKKLPAWIAYFGILLAALAAAIFASGLAGQSLQGFRLFISVIILWIMVVGVELIRGNKA